MGVLSRSTTHRELQNATERAGRLAQRQSWAIARRQLRERGFTDGRLQSWLRTGRLFPHYPGVYSWGRPELSEAGQMSAAVLFAGPGAALTGLTALWWQELLEHRPAPIHVDAPGRVGSFGGIRIRHPREVRRHLHRGVPVTELSAALPLAAKSLSHDSLRLVLARAEYKNLLSLTALEASLRHGVSGSAAIRRAVAAHLPQLARCASRLERDFVLLMERAGVEIPEPNDRIGRYRPDMLWQERMLVVELDGERAHSTAAQLASDAQRQCFLEALGYRVIRFREEDLGRRPDWVVRRVRAALAEPVAA